jgi:hypothetical protein
MQIERLSNGRLVAYMVASVAACGIGLLILETMVLLILARLRLLYGPGNPWWRADTSL